MPNVPDAISVPLHDAQSTEFLHLHATGTQNYACTGTTSGGTTTYAWTLVAPAADLYDDNNVLVGHHSAGPQWALDVVGEDGSIVKGHKIAAAPSPDDPVNDIPWLLLNNINFDPATNMFLTAPGAGTFDQVTYINRVSTLGGVAPTTGCADASQDGATINIDYQADYYFFKH